VSSAASYLNEVTHRLTALHGQLEQIEAAAAICAETIAAGKLVHVFGAGHSHMACEEAYPRMGGVVGFNPVVELAVSHFTPVIGPNGLRQALFLERVPGYGRVIFESLEAEPEDATIVFSNSGVEHIIIDYTRAAKEAGLKVIAVTSLEYSGLAAAERGDAVRHADLADVVIDNGVPPGDAVARYDEFPYRVGPASSILSLAVMNAVSVATAAGLLARGVEPMVFASTHLKGVPGGMQRFEDCVAAFRDRVQRRL
jgi:uncharacterized phosphosugar-binding protein